MKNKYLKIFYIFAMLLSISFISSFIIYNRNIIFLNSNERKLTNIPLNKIEYNGFEYTNGSLVSYGELNQIKLNYTGYINKLIINYETNDNIPFLLTYYDNNYYGKKYEKEIKDSFTTKLNQSYTLIKDNVNHINIKFTGKNNFKIKSIEVDNELKINIYLFIYILCLTSTITVIYLYFKHKLFGGKIEKLFLSIVFLIGTLFILLQPYMTGFSWDDQIHFDSIYKVFELDGQTKWTEAYATLIEIGPFGDSINTSEERRLQNDYLNNKNDVVKTDNNHRLISYDKVGYIIPALVLKICRIIGVSTTTAIILTKFSMLVSYGLIMYFAIKIVPYGKRIISIFGLVPTLMFLSTQFSHDTPIIALLILFIAEFLSIIYNKDKKIDLKICLVLLLSAIIASFIKAIYIPIILLALFIPKENFINDKQRKYFKIGIILIFLMIMITFVLPTLTESDSMGDFRGGNTSSTAQLHLILQKPIGYIRVLNDNAVSNLTDRTIGANALYNYSYITSVLSTPSYANIYYIVLLLFTFVIITDSYIVKKISNSKIIKIAGVIAVIAIMILIWTALYIAYTPVGELTINGVQNRYFLPLIIPFILICLSNDKIKTSYNSVTYDTVIISIISAILFYSLYAVYFTDFCM